MKVKVEVESRKKADIRAGWYFLNLNLNLNLYFVFPVRGLPFWQKVW